MLAPLMLLHRLLTVEFLMADIAFEWAVIAVSSLVNLERD